MVRKKKNEGSFEFNGANRVPYTSPILLGNDMKKTKINEYGEIVEEDGEIGLDYFRKDGKEFYNLTGPDGSTQTIEVKDEPFGLQFDRLLNYTNSKEKLGLKSSDEKNIIFRKARIPFMVQKGKTYEYSGVKVDLGNGADMVLIDERLDSPAKIATLYHELVHAKGYDFPARNTQKENDEIDKKTHLETIFGLRKMYEKMPELYNDIENNKVPGLSEADLFMFDDKNEKYNPQILRDAVNYAIASRASFDISRQDIRDRIRQNKPGKLETSLSILFLISGVLIAINSGSISGNVILGDFNKISLVGAGLFLIGTLILIVKSIINRI